MSHRHWVFLIAVTVTGVFFVDWCDVVFDCGCRSLWNGVAIDCNIHHPAGPHCPWCAHPLMGGGVAFAAAIAAQWAVAYRTGLEAPLRLGLALAAFPVTSGLVALVQRAVWSY